MNQYKALKDMEVPKHVAVIMDGNGRWAKEKGKKRTFGHKNGSDTLKVIARAASDMGVKYLTVYAFSTENWKRPTDEVSYLMGLLRQYLKESIKNAKKDNMRVIVLGSRDDLAPDIREAIEKLEEASKDFTGLSLQLAINYGGRDEIVRAINKMLKDELGTIEEKDVAKYLDTKELPDPELMIRTSGEFRTSNFLLWQMAYTEFHFIDKHWPDFTEEDLIDAIISYNGIERRFGGILNEN